MIGPAFLTRADLMDRWAAAAPRTYGAGEAKALKASKLVGPPCLLCGCRIRRGMRLRRCSGITAHPRDPYGRPGKKPVWGSFVCHEGCFQHWWPAVPH